MIDFQKFLDQNYLFEPRPEFSFKFFLPSAIFFALMFLTGIFLPILLRRKYRKIPPYQKLDAKTKGWLITFSLIGFILIFLRWQAIPYLSARILPIILLFSFLIWLSFFLIYLRHGFRKEIAQYQEKVRQQKYLPKKRKK